MSEPVVLRAPMRSRRDDADPALDQAAVDRALALELVGMGVVTDDRAQRRLARFAEVPDGSWAWTRSTRGLHLGRIDGPHRIDDTAEARRLDLVHVRPCRWHPEPIDPVLVPEQVAYAFSRGGRNLQRIGTTGATARTAETWDLLDR